MNPGVIGFALTYISLILSRLTYVNLASNNNYKISINLAF